MVLCHQFQPITTRPKHAAVAHAASATTEACTSDDALAAIKACMMTKFTNIWNISLL
jgi:hypothetical protein